MVEIGQQQSDHIEEVALQRKHRSLGKRPVLNMASQLPLMQRAQQAQLRVSSAIAEGQQMGYLLQIAVDSIADILSPKSVWFASFDTRRKLISHFVTSAYGTSPSQPIEYEELWTGICGQALLEREVAVTSDEDSRLAVPVQFSDELLGVIILDGNSRTSSFDEECINFVKSIGNQIATVIYHKRSFDNMQLRSVRMETAAEIARATTSMLGLDELLPRSVELIRDRFSYYYVGVFLMDDANEWAVLRAGTGEPGRLMLTSEHKLHRGSDSMIGLCVRSAVPRIALNVAEEVNRYANPMLPDTQSEMALPLVSRGIVIGAMTIQSEETYAFTRDDITVLQTMSDQLANAIQNARLYATSQESIHELQRLQQNFALDSWSEYIDDQDVIGFSYDLNEVSDLASFEQMNINELLQDTNFIMSSGVEGGDGAILRHSLNIRGEPVGLMSFEEPGAAKEWSEDQVVVLDAVREQLELALENRLLIDRSQRALHEAQQRESELEFLQEISALLNATNDIADSSVDLMARIADFTPVNHLAMIRYDQQIDQLSVLAGQGAGISVYLGWTDNATFDDSGFRWMVQQDTVVIEDDIRITPHFLEDIPLANAGVLARLLLPLKLGVRTLGVLELGSLHVGVFSRPGVLPILQQVGAQVASALERGNLLNVAQENAEESQTLYEVTRQLSEATDAPAILQAFYDHILTDISASAEIGVFVTDPETGTEQNWYEISASYSNSAVLEATPQALRSRVEEVPALRLITNQHLFICEDVTIDDRVDDVTRAQLEKQNTRALIAMELTMGVAVSERIGLLLIKFSEPYTPTDQDIRLYTTIADQTAVVLSNRQLYQEVESRVQRQAAAVELANLTTSLSDRDALLKESVSFLQQRFNLYFAGIFMLDELSQWAVLQAGTGDVGERLLLMGYRSQVEGDSLVARCIRDGHRVLALDVKSDLAILENPLLPETRSMLVFPLVSRGQTNGAITLQSSKRFAFTQEDVATLELMVNQLANVIESTNLYERSQSSLEETRMLYRIAQQITDARDAEAVLKAAVDGISQRVEPDWITAGLLEPQNNPVDLRIVESWSRDSTPPPIKALPLNQIKRIYDVLQSDDRFVTPDATQDPMVDNFLRGIYMQLGLRATAIFQIRVRGAQYGTIMVHSRKAREFTTAELNFYENVARQAFVALENISLVDTTREQA